MNISAPLRRPLLFMLSRGLLVSFFPLEINFIETLYCCIEFKASSTYRYFGNTAGSQYLGTFRRDIFIQIWLLLFLILVGIRYFI